MTASDATASAFPTASQLVDRVPLIKNPAFWAPPPVQVPLDIHPLPDDVEAYFVYPHTLEDHVLSTLPAQLEHLEQTRAQRVALLHSYSESKERVRKAKLQALAPGWNDGQGGVMQPVRKPTQAASTLNQTTTTLSTGGATHPEDPGVSDELHSSPTEMGPETIDKMQRDQMQDWLNKFDGASTEQGASAGSAVNDLI
ncbi:uncharacterized protein JCM15063_006555 [Sporobolomyces koalae]|uniref:uncharacterized protein n=1 Tax=Sporobolomyces koalae TaxID=500713 RepID=UPI00317CB558